MKDISSELAKIHLSPSHLSGREIEYIDKTFLSNFDGLTTKNISQFEQRIKEYTGGGEVIATNTGTSAIHLALIAAGVEKEDLVICQSLTFVASANPIRYQGAIPVFVDSEEKTWNMDPLALEESILACINGTLNSSSSTIEYQNLPAKLPKAIIVVHLYGMPANMQEINRIAQKYGIKVIEDAAEALGSTYKGIHCGTLGDFGVFSFNGNKIITTGGGGALLSRNPQEISKTRRHISSNSKTCSGSCENSNKSFNYSLSNLSASIGLAQMEVLEDRILKRREIFALYKYFLSENPSITFLDENEDSYSNRWLTTILIDPSKTSNRICKDKIRNHLNSLGIESSPIMKPMHLQPIYKDYPYFGTKLSELLFQQGLCLPSGSVMSWEEVYLISEEINKLTLEEN